MAQFVNAIGRRGLIMCIRSTLSHQPSNTLLLKPCRPLLHRQLSSLGATSPKPNHLSNTSLEPTHQLCHVRCYAKKTQKVKKEKGKKGSKPKVQLSEEELSSVVNIDKYRHQLDLAVQNLQQEYIEQLSIRTAAGVFDHLQVETPDGKFPLIQLGQVAQKNPQLVAINLAAVPQYIPAVKKALEESGMNLNPQQDGTALFVPIPKMSREHRENLSKSAKTLCDKTKDKLRDAQNRFLKDVKKVKDGHSEDIIKAVQDTIQHMSHEYSVKAEDLMKIKQNELLGGK